MDIILYRLQGITQEVKLGKQLKNKTKQNKGVMYNRYLH